MSANDSPPHAAGRTRPARPSARLAFRSSGAARAGHDGLRPCAGVRGPRCGDPSYLRGQLASSFRWPCIYPAAARVKHLVDAQVFQPDRRAATLRPGMSEWTVPDVWTARLTRPPRPPRPSSSRPTTARQEPATYTATGRYLYERLGDQRFQQLCSALSAHVFPEATCFPVGQSDGGRDGRRRVRPVSGTSSQLIYQVKSTTQEVRNPVTWLDAAVKAGGCPESRGTSVAAR